MLQFNTQDMLAHIRTTFITITLFMSSISIAQESASTSSDEPVLTVSEEMPSFPGGETAMIKFLYSNLNYPQHEKETGISGKCYVSFVVEKDGSVSTVNLLKGIPGGEGCDKEAIRVVSSMPKWIPGKQNGREVRVQFNLPIKFTTIAPVTKHTPEQQEKINTANAYYNKAVELAKKEEYENALREFENVLTILPNDVEAIYNKGYMYHKLNRNNEACAIWYKLKNSGNSIADDALIKICNSLSTKAQTDTIYYNSNWDKCSKSEATFYRIILKQDNGYLVKDMYVKSNLPQMIALCSSLEPLKKNGMCTFYLESGQKESEGNYTNDKRIGIWTDWDDDNKDSSIVECFADGKYKNVRISVKNTTANDKYNILYLQEQMPQFPGGEEEMMRFIQKNIVYPKSELNSGLEGTCYVTFVVEKDGTISDTRILKGVHDAPKCNAEALRVVNSMPTWKPGLQYGRPVRVQFNLPIKFIARNYH